MRCVLPMIEFAGAGRLDHVTEPLFQHGIGLIGLAVPTLFADLPPGVQKLQRAIIHHGILVWRLSADGDTKRHD